MDQDGKKISFAFSKLSKKPNVIPKPPPIIRRQNIQLIDCLEGQAIKLKNAVKEVKGPLVIPLTQSKTIFDHQNEKKIKREVNSKENNVDDRPDSELTADELAARELIRDAQNSLKGKESPKIHTLQAVLQNTFQVEGKEVPTRDDYEAVPIGEYGLAMLRGMGWSESAGVGKIPGKSIPFDDPVLRPKGLGLGANKLVNHNKEKKSTDKNEEELILKKGGYAKIITGKHKGSYCEVQGFDEDGRIIVKTTVKALILNLNELLVQPVSKGEYSKSSKVINNAKYEEYKNKAATELSNTKKSPERRERSRSRKLSSEVSYRKKHSQRNSRSDSEGSNRRNHSKRRERRNSMSDSEDSNRKDHSKSRHIEQRGSRSGSEGSTKRNRSKRRERRNSRSDSEGSAKRNHSKRRERKNSRSESEGSTRRNHSKRRERKKSKSDSEDSNKKNHSKSKEHKSYKDDKQSYRSKSKKKYRSSSISSTDSVYKQRKESTSYKERKHKSKKSKHQKEHRSSSDYDLDHNHTRRSYGKHKY